MEDCVIDGGDGSIKLDDGVKGFAGVGSDSVIGLERSWCEGVCGTASNSSESSAKSGSALAS